MSPALNGSTAIQHFERGNVVEIRNGIMFDFYPGLPHMHEQSTHNISLKTAGLDVIQSHAGHVSANTRPHQLRWGDWEIGNTISCTAQEGLIKGEGVKFTQPPA